MRGFNKGYYLVGLKYRVVTNKKLISISGHGQNKNKRTI
jgi:hypothetical protein